MASEKDAPEKRVFNINVGLLGHVDSGKTSLARALSTELSTASLDKHPQSQARGITLDLGFSAFMVDLPHHLHGLPYDFLQFTLVDCPGHASLIRTIIGGAQIIDIMILVIDITKGIQTQTAECIVIGEITPTKDMIVVLNKIDLLPSDKRDAQINKMKKRVHLTLKNTKFQNCSIVALSANPSENQEGIDCSSSGLNILIDQLKLSVRETNRVYEDPFLFSIDHCFPIRGQGTVLTGTVLQGSVSVNQIIELPSLKLQRKVKSMQMFHRPVSKSQQGDRVGICVSQIDAASIERGLAAEPGTVPTMHSVIVSVKRIRFFKNQIKTKSKFHVTLGHTTVMATPVFFSIEKNIDNSMSELSISPGLDFNRDYLFEEELPPATDDTAKDAPASEMELKEFFVLLIFDSYIVCSPQSLLVASRLDTDINMNTCRLAFHGHILSYFSSEDEYVKKLRIFKMKQREGSIERVVDSKSVIAKGFFKKETDITPFLGLKVSTNSGAIGVISSSFGKSGKCKVLFQDDLNEEEIKTSNKLILRFKRYIYDASKKMIQ